MKCLLPPLLAACGLFVSLHGLSGAEPESIHVWHPTVGTERTGDGALVSPLHAPGATADTITFALVSGEGDVDNTSFTVTGDELRTAAALPENEYSIRLRATGEGGLSVEEVFTISVVPESVAPKVAAGFFHTVVLSSDGTVFSFGDGRNGRLGQDSTENLSVPTPIEHENLTGHTIVDVAAGSNHTVLLSSEGTVFTFGEGWNGQLGHGNTTSRLVPTPIEHENLSGHRITRIAAGSSQTILLSSDGTVFTFGWGRNGGLGHGDTTDRNAPTPVADSALSGHTITEVAASTHSVVLSSKGAVFTFGPGGAGQLGHGDTEDRLVPTEIDPENLAGAKIIRVAAGGGHTILLSSDERVFTFGNGNAGQLGHGDAEDRTVPTPIENESLSGHSIVEIAAGSSHSVLRAADGTVFSFGAGTFGQLGHGDTSARLEPVPIENTGLTGLAVSGIASGTSHTVLLASDGLVFTVGRGDFGQLGHGDGEDRVVPTRVQNVNLSGRILLELDVAGTGDGTLLLNGEAVFDPPDFLLSEDETEVLLEVVPDEGSFFAGWQGDLTGTDTSRTLNLDAHKQVTAVFGLKSLVVWNQSIAADRANPGALVSRLHAAGPPDDPFTFSLVTGEGDDDNANFLIDGRELRLAEPLSVGDYSIRLRAASEGGLSVERVFSISVVQIESKVAAGDDHTIVLSPDGAVFTFGLGEFGRLGHGDTEDRLFPTGIENETLSEHTIVDIAAGRSHSVLLSSEGTVFTFGRGGGQLGQGDTEDRLVPTPIEHENLDDHTIVRVAAGEDHTLLFSSDGTVFTFGSGNGGKLGHGNTETRLVPTLIEHENLAGHTITGIAAGRNHSVLLSDDGTVFTFGLGRNGELGHGDTESRLVPTQIEHEILSDHTIIGVAAGGGSVGRISDSHTVLVAADGTVFSFGSGRFGQLGHGDIENRLVPTPIEHEGLSGHTISGARAGGLHTILWSEDGAVFSFGRVQSGQLGDGNVQDRLVPARIEHDTLAGHTITGAAAGRQHTVLLSSDGTVFTFGSGEFGRLGHGDTRARLAPAPVPVFRLPGHQILRIRSLGDGNGSVSINGETVSDFPFMTQFGTGTEVTLEAVPGEDSFFERWRDDVSGTNPSQTLTLDEDRRVAAVFGSRSLVAWQRTIGTDRTEAGALVSRLHAPHAAGGSVTFSLVPGEGDEDNASFSVAGDELHTSGPLSTGKYSVRLRATSEDDGPSVEDAFVISVVPGTVEPKVAVGRDHTVYLSSEGTVFTFGSGNSGKLGHGDTENRRVPIPIENEALAGHTIVDVAAGRWHSVLLALDGTVFTFGRGSDGQLGHGDIENRLTPAPIHPEGLNGRAITGIAAGADHTVVRSADGTILTFGSGPSGQLGHGDTEKRLVPAPIESENLAGYTISGISVGMSGRRGSTLLLSRNGTVLTFGDGGAGQLGHGDRDDRLIPTPIESEALSGHTITGATIESSHTVLLSSDGTVFTLGAGGAGRLGTGDERNRLTPTPIDDGNLSEQTITQVAAGSNHTVLLSEDGTVYSFGWGNSGRLGHGDTDSRFVPTPIEHENLTGRNITGVFADSAHTALLSTDGTVLTFGSGNGGQLGHGDTESRLVPTPIEFFRLPGHRMYEIDVAGDGVGTVAVNGEPVEEFPFMNQAETGTEILLEAIPGEDSVFSRWEGDLAEAESSFLLKLDTDVRFAAVINLREDLRFQNAMADAGLSGEDAEPDATPFGDGVSNLLKYAFNMDASGPDNHNLTHGQFRRSGLPTATLEDGAEPVLVIEFLRRRHSGLVYTPRVSTDLDSWEPVTEEPTVNVIDPNWERVAVEIPLDPSVTRAFGSVRVTLP